MTALIRYSLVCFLVCMCLPVEAGEPKGPLVGFAIKRTWSDKSGKFKIEGSLKSADAKVIRILKPDSKVVDVPVDKLSESDHAFVQGFLAAEKALSQSQLNPEDDDANPFKGGVPSDNPSDKPMNNPSEKSSAKPLGNRPRRSPASESETSEGETESSNSAAIPKRKAGINGFKPLSIVPAREFWSVKTPRAFPDVSFEDALIQTSLKKPFFAGIQVMGAGKVGTIILNSYQEGRNRDAFGRFVVASATTSESSSVLEFPDPWRLIAISPDGGRFAAVRVEGFDKGNDVAIFRVKDEVITPEFQFTAGGGSWDELHWAAFLPDNRFATISQKHDLTFWDLENKIGPKAIKRGSTGSALKASITPAGELMAFTAGNAVAVLDTTEGKLVGCIKREEPVYSVAFSPKAEMIATLGPFKITLFGMNDGKEIRTVPINDSNPGAELLWLGKHLLVGNVLYDVERGVPLWTYETQAPRAVLGDFLLAGFGGDNSSSVGLFRIPHENAVRVAEEIDPATSYALRPGDSISVEYDFGATPPALQEKIREAVCAKILAVGWKLSNSDENVLTIKLEQGKSEEAEYFEHRGFGPMFHPFGGRPSGTGEKVTYTPWTHTMTLKSQGKQVFSNVYKIGAPQNLRDEKGVTTQSQVDSYCKPSPSYFTNAAIPPYMLKAEYQGGLGKSRIDASGLK